MRQQNQPAERMLAYMNEKTHQSPSVPVYKKALRTWTYYIFPEGVEQEAGDFADEEAARAASWKTYRAWQANGCKY
jgi:hypoxanthine phosphoribosyltransferase